MQLVAHHAHDRARHHAEELLERRPALHGADGHVGLGHPAVDDGAELGHLEQRGVGNAVGRRRTRCICSSLRCDAGVVVREPVDAAEDLREVDRLDGDAARLEDLLAVAHRLERRGPRADRADARRAQPAHHAADAGEPARGRARNVGESGCSVCSEVSEYGMPYCVSTLHDRHLAAERVAPVGDSHLRRVVGPSRGSAPARRGRRGAACRRSRARRRSSAA